MTKRPLSPSESCHIIADQKIKKPSSSNIIKGFEGMPNPESTSSQSLLQTRENPPLDGELSFGRNFWIEMEKQYKPCLSMVNPTHARPSGTNKFVDSAILDRKERQLVARQFRSDYTYGTSTFVDGCKKSLGHTKERKTCIWSGGTSTWNCKSSGIMWVAVHGKKSICVVTRDDKLDKTRVGRVLWHTSDMEVLHLFRETVISEIEDLADPSSGSHELFDLDKSIRKPFGVVSVTQGFDKVHAECSHETPLNAVFDEEKAMKYLEEKMKSGVAFTYKETIRTAISAFQQLFQRNFNAQEIQVCAWKGEEALDLRRCEIMKYL